MIRSDVFWECEKGAPLLIRNGGYVTKHRVEEVCQRAVQWVDLAQKGKEEYSPDEVAVDELDVATKRIFELDADRTFSDSEHRKEMIHVLRTIHHEIKDYHQGLGFVVAFLLLQLDKTDVAKIAVSLHRHYLPDYFKATAVNYIRDAKVFEKILPMFFPEAGKKIIDQVAAEAYCSKWFIGLNVHVLPFAALADFFDALLVTGHVFLFQFGLALVKNCEVDILAAKDVSQILAILRLDAKQYPNNQTASGADTDEAKEGSFFTKIIEDAITFEMKGVDVEGLREEVENEMAEAAERRRLRDVELGLDDDDIMFSDEEEEDNDETNEGCDDEESKRSVAL